MPSAESKMSAIRIRCEEEVDLVESHDGQAKEKKEEDKRAECRWNAGELGCDGDAGSAASAFQWLPSDSGSGSHHGCERERARRPLSLSRSCQRPFGIHIPGRPCCSARHSPATSAVVKFLRRERPNFGAPEKPEARKTGL